MNRLSLSASPEHATKHEKIKVLIVDDHHVVRVGLRTILQDHPHIEVIGDAPSGEAALNLAMTASPAVVMLDLRLPDLDGLEVCRRLKTHNPAPAVLILTSFADDKTILSSIEAGADGYLLKDATGPDIPTMVLTVARGGSILDPQVARRVLLAVRHPREAALNPLALLNSREMRAIELVSQALSNKQVATKMNLSEGTVRNYLSTAFSKLGVQSRVEAAALYIRWQA